MSEKCFETQRLVFKKSQKHFISKISSNRSFRTNVYRREESSWQLLLTKLQGV